MERKTEQKKCEKCNRKPVRGERFCRHHRTELIREMHKSGYLTPVPRTTRRYA